jgi:hypothetical protein
MAPLGFPRGLHRLAWGCMGGGPTLRPGPTKAGVPVDNRLPATSMISPIRQRHMAPPSLRHTPGPRSSAQPAPCNYSSTTLRSSPCPKGFRGVRPAPSRTVSAGSMIGGGQLPMPGEISLVRHGILFLDEPPEFKPMSSRSCVDRSSRAFCIYNLGRRRPCRSSCNCRAGRHFDGRPKHASSLRRCARPSDAQEPKFLLTISIDNMA